MKLCDKCGAFNSDNRFFCVDCNEKLGDPVSPREQNRIEQNINSNLEALYNDKDPLYVSPFDKVMGSISLIGALASLVLLAVGLFLKLNFWFLWVGILFLALAAVEAFCPKLLWSIEKLRLSFTINNPDDAEPSTFYKVCRKASILIATIIGTVLLLMAVADFRYPPVVKYISDIAATESVAHSSHSKDYIEANPEKWEKIIDSGDYAVSAFLGELEAADGTGLEEVLMMEAINQITGSQISYYTKDDFLFSYYYSSSHNE